MKVRYTPDVFRFQRAGGVSRYFVELARGLQGHGVDARIVAGFHINDLVGDAPRSLGTNVGFVNLPRSRQAATKVLDYALTGGLVEMLGRDDVIHPTWYPPQLQRLPRRARLVTTVHDMIPEMFPDLSVRSVESSRRKRAWVDAADHVLVNSHHTASDLIELFQVDPSKVTVTYLGVTTTAPVRPPGALALERSRFVLYVGDRVTPYKNFACVLDAMAHPDVDPELRLVCMGPASRSAAEEAALVERGIAERVEFVSGSDGHLAWLYSAAVALVYPSIYEGFGLPPLEAMANGCPVIASDAASIPEVVGDAAVLFDPNDANALAEAVSSLAGDAARRSTLIARGRARAATFSWASTVEQTLQVYEDLVS